jgi:hypothetical protein
MSNRLKEKQRAKLTEQEATKAAIAKEAARSAVRQLKSAADLQHQVFEPIKWIAENILPEGLSMLVGKPKVGKSWMALDLGLAVASGGIFLGERCEDGDVLALFLEDNERRLQSRITAMLGANKADWPRRLSYSTEWPRLSDGGTELIEEWIKSVPKPRLIIVDILERVRDRTSSKSNASAYTTDYEALTALHRIATEHRLSILVLHHQRKAAAEDLMDTVSGTGGLGGALDTLLVLGKDEVGSFLYGRGRDLEEFRHAVQQSKDMRYQNLGSRPEAQGSPERKLIVAALFRAKEPMAVRDIAKAVPSMKYVNVKNRLAEMHKDGEVETVARGVYRLPDPQGELDIGGGII